MGFRSGSYATVWEVEPRSDTMTRGRISTSRKVKGEENKYETDFSGFVAFLGTASAKKALGLKERERIKLGDVDVQNKYDKDTKRTYTYYNVFSFEKADEAKKAPDNSGYKNDGAGHSIDEGYEEIDEDDLPF